LKKISYPVLLICAKQNGKPLSYIVKSIYTFLCRDFFWASDYAMEFGARKIIILCSPELEDFFTLTRYNSRNNYETFIDCNFIVVLRNEHLSCSGYRSSGRTDSSATT
jgi:hypothetical protein